MLILIQFQHFTLMRIWIRNPAQDRSRIRGSVILNYGLGSGSKKTVTYVARLVRIIPGYLDIFVDNENVVKQVKSSKILNCFLKFSLYL
jgi:hypothetical protein